MIPLVCGFIPIILSNGVSRLRCCRLFLFKHVLCIHLFHKKSRRLESIHPPLLPIKGIIYMIASTTHQSIIITWRLMSHPA